MVQKRPSSVAEMPVAKDAILLIVCHVMVLAMGGMAPDLLS